MQLNDSEKRWLEINFFLMCKKIFNNRETYSDLEKFFRGFEWTNLYDCDILIKTINNECILYNPNVQPSNRNINNIVNVDNITLPNVKNYDEFKTQMFRDMQTDRKFENMIENMSIDKLDKSYNSLKKLKHRF